jgi:hypothetical protein
MDAKFNAKTQIIFLAPLAAKNVFTTSQYRYTNGKFYDDSESAGKVAMVFPQKNCYG